MKYDPKRPWRGLYNTKRWKILRAHQLTLNPICVMCDQMGRTTAATVVDHKIPHKGDVSLFFDPDNLQSLCKTHHDSSKQAAEKRGVDAIGCDESGWPLGGDHHWNK